jgi:hypothetical protein
MAVLAAGYPPTSERPSLPVYSLKAKMFQLLGYSKNFARPSFGPSLNILILNSHNR